VKGGQIATSTAGAAAAAAAIASISDSCARSPCIFQFPATSLRRITPTSVLFCFVKADSRRGRSHKLDGCDRAP